MNILYQITNLWLAKSYLRMQWVFEIIHDNVLSIDIDKDIVRRIVEKNYMPNSGDGNGPS